MRLLIVKIIHFIYCRSRPIYVVCTIQANCSRNKIMLHNPFSLHVSCQGGCHCTLHYLPVRGASPHHSRSLYRVFLCFPFENFPIRGKRNKISALSLIHTRRQIRTLCGINPFPKQKSARKIVCSVWCTFQFKLQALSSLSLSSPAAAVAWHFPSLNEVRRCCRVSLSTHPPCVSLFVVDVDRKSNRGTHHQKYRTRSSSSHWHTIKEDTVLKWCYC